MKQPSLGRLKIDRAATSRLRAALAHGNRVTITVTLERESLQALKRLSVKSGIPYQRLFNRLLTTSTARHDTIQGRLTRLEQELRKIKRRFAA